MTEKRSKEQLPMDDEIEIISVESVDNDANNQKNSILFIVSWEKRNIFIIKIKIWQRNGSGDWGNARQHRIYFFFPISNASPFNNPSTSISSFSYRSLRASIRFAMTTQEFVLGRRWAETTKYIYVSVTKAWIYSLFLCILCLVDFLEFSLA